MGSTEPLLPLAQELQKRLDTTGHIGFKPIRTSPLTDSLDAFAIFVKKLLIGCSDLAGFNAQLFTCFQVDQTGGLFADIELHLGLSIVHMEDNEFVTTEADMLQGGLQLLEPLGILQPIRERTTILRDGMRSASS